MRGLLILLLGWFAAIPVATPEAISVPVAPDPDDCTITPLPEEEWMVLVRDTHPQARPEPVQFDPPEGEPIDAATVAGIVATVVGFIACENARDLPRAWAYMTEQSVTESIAHNLTFLTRSQLGSQASWGARPLSLYEWMRVLAVQDAVRVGDGRVAVVVIYTDPFSREPYVVRTYELVEQDGRWLIDAIIRHEPVDLWPPTPDVDDRHLFDDVVDALREQGLDVNSGRPARARSTELSPPGEGLEVNGIPLYVFIYPDAASREDESNNLDPATIRLTNTAGIELPIESLHVVSGSNVIVVLTGGSDDVREQVEHAIEGLPELRTEE